MIGVRDLVVQRGGRAVVDGVDLTVEAGEIVALVGPNGAGKSSLLAAITGDVTPASGSVTLAGRPREAWRPRERAQRVASLPQHPEAALGLTAWDVVSLGLELTHGTAPRDTVRRALHRVGLDGSGSRAVVSLSGGQRQRTHLARVLAQAELATEPLAVLLDEPTAAQDPGMAGRVLGHLQALAAQGHAVLVVIHDLGAAAAVADRLVMLADGAVQAAGPPETVLSTSRLRTLYGPALDAGRCPDTGRHWVVPRPQEVS